MNGYLSRDEMLALVKHAPLVSIDLLVTRPDGSVLLGLRENEPARDHWFAPGGRILKGERLSEAFARLTRGELGQAFALSEASLLGVYEHHYETNFAQAPGVSTHYVVLGHRLPVAADFAPAGDDQHRELRWWRPEQMTEANGVHRYTREYLPALTGR
ncbi:MAG: NUDIX domain-containing protein [Nitrospirota bacterium]|nr:NUDIX domain-containing protein [Nitrospirota bacterium]